MEYTKEELDAIAEQKRQDEELRLQREAFFAE
jgi:hypothetical protein